jgi:very-short-patch-repair endonuclease
LHGYFLDIAMEFQNPAKKICLDVLGPTHFYPNKQLSVVDKLRHKIIQKSGWTIITISYSEWDSKKDPTAKYFFLKEKIFPVFSLDPWNF